MRVLLKAPLFFSVLYYNSHTRTGQFEEIGGVNCYVATPPGDYPKDKVVLFLTDVFGLELINNKLLVDDFARNGYKTIAPDILNGEPLVDFNSPTFDRAGWVSRHGPDSWKSVVDKVVDALKASGVTRIGTTGYCFGAPPAFYLALKNESHVTVVAHPSRLEVPGDLEVRSRPSFHREDTQVPLALLRNIKLNPRHPCQSIVVKLMRNSLRSRRLSLMRSWATADSLLDTQELIGTAPSMVLLFGET